ncbi:hypothetical protein Taro_050608 [Colocasia esculenta]|uniref:Uncharacterized protein n=1 Tax=Colocasia esculenta TaxID=4460 RepID=A0A843XDV2_COLES|nr:hypothetical protein [Colocasia esculenta]
MAAVGGAVLPPGGRPRHGGIDGRSFAQALAASFELLVLHTTIHLPAFMDHGEPACYFSKQDAITGSSDDLSAGVPRSGEALPDPRLDLKPFLADPFFFLVVRRRCLLPFHARGGSVFLLSFVVQPAMACHAASMVIKRGKRHLPWPAVFVEDERTHIIPHAISPLKGMLKITPPSSPFVVHSPFGAHVHLAITILFSPNATPSLYVSSDPRRCLQIGDHVQEFYLNLECTDEGYKSDVKGVLIDLPTELAATLFRVPDEGESYHDFEFDLHAAYSMLIGLPTVESEPKQTYVTKFNTNTFPPALKLVHHILTTIITPQGDQVRRGPGIVEAPVVPEEVDPPPAVHSPAHDQAEQSLNEVEAPIPPDVPQDIPLSPTLHTSSPQIPNGQTFLARVVSTHPLLCVDTGSSGLDTRSSSQKTCLPVWDSVSTQPEVVSTLVTLPRE